jgi:PE family
MSFMIATPDLVQGAAQVLAGIRSSLAEATATAAGPTTGVAAAAQDEVSVAMASLFGGVGQEFQALSAQAQAFHAEFVNLMNAGAGAYVAAEGVAGQTLMSAAAAPAQALLGGSVIGGGQVLGNIGQSLGGVVAGGQAAVGQIAGQVGQSLNGVLMGAMTGAPAAPTVAQGIGSFWAAAAAPYQQLVINTNNNLAAINQTFMANPFPFANRVIINQQDFAETFGTGVVTDLQGFPGNVAANIQLAIQGASTFNPGALAAAFVNGQIGTAQTVIASLQNTSNAMVTGAPAFQAGVQTAFQDLLVGNNVAAYSALQQGMQSLFLPGFEPVAFTMDQMALVPVIPMGLLGALTPIIALPGQMAQSFTNLLPPGSILAQMSQNATNTISALTNLNTTINPAVTGTGSLLSLDFLVPAVNFGPGLQLAFDAIGAPGLALSGLNSSAVSFMTAVQAGNPSAAALALLDAPANMTNGFLNGSTLITLPPLHATVSAVSVDIPVVGDLDLVQVPATTTTEIPIGGLLTPLSLPTLNTTLTIPVLGAPLIINGVQVQGSTMVGGLIPGLQSIASQLATDITPPM